MRSRMPVRCLQSPARAGVSSAGGAGSEAAGAAGEIAADVDADSAALTLGSLTLGIAIERLLDPALDMAAMRRTAERALRGVLGI